MPNLDQTGPNGEGSLAGGGRGSCNSDDQQVNNERGGFGRGCGRWQGRGRGCGRPRSCRRVEFSPDITYYKPQGVPISDLKVVNLTLEEIEALRLKSVEDLSQTECAEKMDTSQSTFQRILSSAYKKVSTAIVNGMAIEIHKK